MYIGGCRHEMKMLRKIVDRLRLVGRRETKIKWNKIATKMQCRCSNKTRSDKTRKKEKGEREK